VGDLEEAEKALDVAALVAEAVDNIERVILEL
jgi:tellurite resistance protein